MVNFEDLCQEDQLKILNQVRQIVDEENTKKHAVTMYALKKKDLTESNLENIYKHLGLKVHSEQIIAKQRYVSMVNYLYKMSIEKHYRGNSIKAMTTEEEWNIYKSISTKVFNLMTSTN